MCEQTIRNLEKKLAKVENSLKSATAATKKSGKKTADKGVQTIGRRRVLSCWPDKHVLTRLARDAVAFSEASHILYKMVLDLVLVLAETSFNLHKT